MATEKVMNPDRCVALLDLAATTIQLYIDYSRLPVRDVNSVCDVVRELKIEANRLRENAKLQS